MTTRELLPVTTQSSCLSMVKQHFNELEDICEGVLRLQELSLRTKDRIISFGNCLSSKIISAYMLSLDLTHEWIDSREVIKTNSQFGFAAVNFPETNQLHCRCHSTSRENVVYCAGLYCQRMHNVIPLHLAGAVPIIPQLFLPLPSMRLRLKYGPM